MHLSGMGYSLFQFYGHTRHKRNHCKKHRKEGDARHDMTEVE